MRGKRAKQYRKLMEQFQMSFGFREPYQVLVDADFVRDTQKFKMDMIARLEGIVHGKVKPMITQCSMRHLYSSKSEPGTQAAIEFAKNDCERRRCGHHPDEYPEPLSTMDCLMSVIDPKETGNNKHRYVVACQDQDVRRRLRQVKGVPLIYVSRSVMIMEPMASASAEVRAKEEKSKFRLGIKDNVGAKRKREDDDEVQGGGKDSRPEGEEKPKKKKTNHGPKQPNPLSVKKPKKTAQNPTDKPPSKDRKPADSDAVEEAPAKKKRKRKHKPRTDDGQAPESGEALSQAVSGEAAATGSES